MLDEKLINKYLKRDFGYQEGGANFRLVRTTEQLEHRKMVVPHIVAGIDFGMIEVFRSGPKYNYLGEKPYWALERLFSTDSVTKEILKSNWTYEPIMIFNNPETGAEMPVNQDIIYALINLCLYYPKRKALTPEEYDAQEEAEFEKQSGVILQYLENEAPSMAIQLKHGSGIVVPEMNTNG